MFFSLIWQLSAAYWNWKHHPGHRHNYARQFPVWWRRNYASPRLRCGTTYRRALSTTTFSANRIEWMCWRKPVSMRTMRIRCWNFAVISRCRHIIAVRVNHCAMSSPTLWTWRIAIGRPSMIVANLHSVGGGHFVRSIPLPQCTTMVMPISSVLRKTIDVRGFFYIRLCRAEQTKRYYFIFVTQRCLQLLGMIFLFDFIINEYITECSTRGLEKSVIFFRNFWYKSKHENIQNIRDSIAIENKM